MKIYQIMYTCSPHSITDEDLGFTNSNGYGVYSFSKGLTKEEINEVIKFANYKLPNDCVVDIKEDNYDGKYSKMYPKVFRTLRISSGKFVALQSVFAGNDHNGLPKNFFAHAFVIDAEGDVQPDLYRYMSSPDFKEYLTKDEFENENVEHLPILDSVKKVTDIDELNEQFISKNKKSLSYLLEKLLSVIAEPNKVHMLISSEDYDKACKYIYALKSLLPKSLSDAFGVSTYNINIPSEKQKRIKLYGFKKDFGNFSVQALHDHIGCEFVDIDTIESEEHDVNIILEYGNEMRDALYKEYGFSYAQQILSWLNSYRLDAQSSKKLKELRDNCGNLAYVRRCSEILMEIDTEKYYSTKFEILDAICSNIKLFGTEKNNIITKYMVEGFSSICNGEDVNLENTIRNEDCIEGIYGQLSKYMESISKSEIQSKNGMLILRAFSIMKQKMGIPTWKLFFEDNDDYLTEFIDLSAVVIINHTNPVTFTAPAVWNDEELGEVIAYFDSSTDDPAIRRACRKFILSNPNIKWGVYGITFLNIKKSEDETERDIQKIRAMLLPIGYVPFGRRTYQELKFQVSNEMNSVEDPLLLTRLLYSVYMWQNMETKITDSKIAAQRVYDLILELKEKERPCYDFVFPKLAIEILDSPGSFHEIMINADTMTPEFWNWFLLSYMKNNKNEEVKVVYRRVFEASEPYLTRETPSLQRLKRIIEKNNAKIRKDMN